MRSANAGLNRKAVLKPWKTAEKAVSQAESQDVPQAFPASQER
nr:MAG TPA: hypothetical protein [Caudoviricetes sp.]